MLRSSGRPLTPAAIVFGLLHGVSEGALYLSLWVQLPASLDRATAVGVAFGVIAMFNTVWRTLWWDVWITPEHNIAEWNVRKVLWVHVPVLLLVLGHLAAYERAALFIVFETIALTGSAVHMRFPAPSLRTIVDRR